MIEHKQVFTFRNQVQKIYVFFLMGVHTYPTHLVCLRHCNRMNDELGKSNKKMVKMLSDITSKTYEDLKREAVDKSRWRKRD